MDKNQMVLVSLLIFLHHITKATIASETSPPTSSKHFVLVHGSCHGAWSWYKLVPLLRSSGHRVTALDLAASGINPELVDDIPSVSDYFKPLQDFMASLPRHERVVLVGHSFGGLAVCQAMENFPEKISVAVFVTAMMPGPCLNISTLFQEEACHHLEKHP
ncbi:hypothetical protein CsSME_00009519 [Camellia sinensis var. sinensis]